MQPHYSQSSRENATEKNLPPPSPTGMHTARNDTCGFLSSTAFAPWRFSNVHLSLLSHHTILARGKTAVTLVSILGISEQNKYRIPDELFFSQKASTITAIVPRVKLRKCRQVILKTWGSLIFFSFFFVFVFSFFLWVALRGIPQ